jgi:hypothetical protein
MQYVLGGDEIRYLRVDIAIRSNVLTGFLWLPNNINFTLYTHAIPSLLNLIVSGHVLYDKLFKLLVASPVKCSNRVSFVLKHMNFQFRTKRSPNWFSDNYQRQIDPSTNFPTRSLKFTVYSYLVFLSDVELRTLSCCLSRFSFQTPVQ